MMVQPTDHAAIFHVGILLFDVTHAAGLKGFEETHHDLQALEEINLP